MTALGVVGLQGAIRFSLSAVPATGTIVDFHKTQARSASTIASVDVKLPGRAPFRREITDTFGTVEWSVRGIVQLRCSHVESDEPNCQISSWAEVWLWPIVFFGIGATTLWYVQKRASRSHP